MTVANTKVLGVIIARGGSRGLPRKNVLPLVGKPLVAYTIEAARDARHLDRWLVSTEDDEIAEISRQLGADVPFIRPQEFARDETLATDVLRHALGWLLENEGYVPDYVMCLQPTTPLRTAEDIDRSIALAIEKDADAVVGYARAKQSPYWMKQITEDGRIIEFLPPNRAYLRRQGVPDIYHVSGSIYLVKPTVLFEKDSFYTDKTYAYIVPTERAVDIDTLQDFRIAEMLLKEQAAEVVG